MHYAHNLFSPIFPTQAPAFGRGLDKYNNKHFPPPHWLQGIPPFLLCGLYFIQSRIRQQKIWYVDASRPGMINTNTIAEAFCKEVPALRYTLHDTFGQCARAMMHCRYCRVMRLSVMERLRGKNSLISEIVSRFYPNFIQILSKFYPHFIHILSD